MESAFPPEAQATFRNMENNGNPWGLGWQTRAKWAEGLDVPTIAEAPDAAGPGPGSNGGTAR